MAKPLVPDELDELWEWIAPLLPPERPSDKEVAARSGLRCAYRYSIRAAQRHSLGVLAAGAGLRQWRHLLAPPAGVATGLRVGPLAPPVVG